MNDQLQSKITDIRRQFDAFLAEAAEARGASPEQAAATFSSIAERLRTVETSIADLGAASNG